jgi:hypothetical protein
MAASPIRERRGALWPWLVMPLIVLAAFYALHGVHKRPGPLAPSYQGASDPGQDGR